MKKLNIDDVLAKQDVKTLHKAEEKAIAHETAEEKARKLDEMRARAGRPKKDKSEKAKPKTLYFSDAEWIEIEKIAKLNQQKPNEFIKIAIAKAIMREKGL